MNTHGDGESNMKNRTDSEPTDQPAGWGNPVKAGPFSVHDAVTANWVVRKIREARAYRQHVAAWAEKERRRAKAEEEFFLLRYEGQLRDWLLTQPAVRRGRRRFVDLPAGRVALRRGQPQLTITDPTIVIAWCRQMMPDALAVQIELIGQDAKVGVEALTSHCPSASINWSVRKDVLRHHLRTHGEVPDGAHLGDATVSLHIG